MMHWKPTMMTQTVGKIQLLRRPLKTLSSSLIFRELISLKSCSQMKTLKTSELVVRCSSSCRSEHSNVVSSGSQGETLKENERTSAERE